VTPLISLPVLYAEKWVEPTFRCRQ